MPENIVPQACWHGKWEMAQHNRGWFLSRYISQNEDGKVCYWFSASHSICVSLCPACLFFSWFSVFLVFCRMPKPAMTSAAMIPIPIPAIQMTGLTGKLILRSLPFTLVCIRNSASLWNVCFLLNSVVTEQTLQSHYCLKIRGYLWRHFLGLVYKWSCCSRKFLHCLNRWELHTFLSAVLGQSSNPNLYKLASHLLAKFKGSKMDRGKTGGKVFSSYCSQRCLNSSMA